MREQRPEISVRASAHTRARTTICYLARECEGPTDFGAEKAAMGAWAGIATDWSERPLRGSKADLRRSQREWLTRAPIWQERQWLLDGEVGATEVGI